ncbi:hypothetical protein [Brachybacterium sp. YJGR34]|uniref:hypothetical protein n=1 Tax=Brachybacterium sp. YJGR34 TaxID=2059911 RepID=UPI000E0A31A0|nr:hypothetical protein [Brachybacterium sp. YJGR34]
MINQLRADLYVLRHSGTAALCLLAAVLAATGYTALQHSLAVGDLSANAASGVQGLSDILLVSLLGPLLYGVVVSQPFETRSVHDALLSSGRGAFIASTTLIGALLVTALSLPYGVAVLIGRATGAEFAAALPTAFSQLLAAESAGAGTIIAVTLASALLMAAKLAVCLPLAILVKRPLVVMAAGFLWSFVADLLAGALDDIPGLEALLRLTPFSAERLPGVESSAAELWTTLAVSAVFIALMGVVSWLLFRRADVK